MTVEEDFEDRLSDFILIGYEDDYDEEEQDEEIN